MSTHKILVTGDIKGQWMFLIKKLKSVQIKSGPFEMCLVVGSAFSEKNDESWSDIKSGKIKFPIPVYILGPNSSEELSFYKDLNGYEICENLIYLGLQGCFTTAEGLKIAYISGVEHRKDSKEQLYDFSLDRLKDLERQLQWTNGESFNGVDILVSSEWPERICNLTNNSVKFSGSSLIAQIATQSRPRYHFAGLYNCHYERQPYRNHKISSDTPRHVTRFIGLGTVNNEFKYKWMYAFNIVPLTSLKKADLIKEPSDVTESPFSLPNIASKLRPKQFFFDSNTQNEPFRKRSGNPSNQSNINSRNIKQLKGSCWFCLSEDDVEKHLVVSIGEFSYLALPKGGLNSDHVLILPISHYASSLELPDETSIEMNKYKNSLVELFSSQEKGVVFYERFYRCFHTQIQCITYDKNRENEIKDFFTQHHKSQELSLTKVPENSKLSKCIQSGRPFFAIEFPELYFAPIKSGFDLNFGRDILAEFLDLKDKVDWRSCRVSKEKEIEMAEKFRENFKNFDFTLE